MSNTHDPYAADFKQKTFTTHATPNTAAALSSTPIRTRRVGFKVPTTNTAAVKLRPASAEGSAYYIELSAGDEYWIEGAADTSFDLAVWRFESSAASQTLHVLYQD